MLKFIRSKTPLIPLVRGRLENSSPDKGRLGGVFVAII